MSQPTNQNQSLERLQGESSSFFNFGDHFSAKIASILQDLTGLPSAFSRDNFTHGSWRNTNSHQNMCNEDSKASSQQDRQVMGDKAFEIPVKKYPRWATGLTNNLPSETERRVEANQNNCTLNRPSNTSYWQELVLGIQYLKAEAEDYKRLWDNADYSNSMESVKFFPGNQQNSPDLYQKNDLSCFFLEMPSFESSKVTSMPREIFDRADFLSSQLFQEVFDPYFGPSKNPNLLGKPFLEPSGLDAKNENIKSGIAKSLPLHSYEAKTSRFETLPWLQRESERVILNPFDGQICDGAQTELDLYDFFSRCLSPKNKDREVNITTNRDGNLKQNLVPQFQLQKLPREIGFPFSSFFKEFTEIHESSSKAVGNPDRVISSFSSTTQRLDHSGKLHTSIQVTKTYEDGRSTSTTKDYIENIDTS